MFRAFHARIPAFRMGSTGSPKIAVDHRVSMSRPISSVIAEYTTALATRGRLIDVPVYDDGSGGREASEIDGQARRQAARHMGETERHFPLLHRRRQCA